MPENDVKGAARRLHESLPMLVSRFRVPGCVVGLADPSTREVVCEGVRDSTTRAPVSRNTAFEIGSVTKMFTAELVGRALEGAGLSCGTPIAFILPELARAWSGMGGTISFRHLLCHTSGLEADYFVDTGDADDAIERLMRDIKENAQIVLPPGALFSYSNIGYVILGAAVERLRCESFRSALSTLLPVSSDPREQARGHVSPRLEPVGPSPLPRSNEPAGSSVIANVDDLLDALQTIRIDGLRELSPAVKVPQPSNTGAVAWVPGSAVYNWGRSLVYGHDGGTIGQAASVRVLPQRNICVTIQTNGGEHRAFAHAILAETFADLGAVAPPPLLTPAEAIPVSRAITNVVAGTYETTQYRVAIECSGDSIRFESQPLGELAVIAGSPPPFESDLVPQDRMSLISRAPVNGVHQLYTFHGKDGKGRAIGIHNGRFLPRAPFHNRHRLISNRSVTRQRNLVRP